MSLPNACGLLEKDSYLSWVMLVVGVELNSSGSGSKSCRRPVLKEEIAWELTVKEVAAGPGDVRTRSMSCWCWVKQ